MDVVATVEVPVAPEKLFAYISDLANYESWLEIVHSVKSFDANSWTVELRAHLGPFARSKRLRMVRTSCDEPNSVVFERSEKMRVVTHLGFSVRRSTKPQPAHRSKPSCITRVRYLLADY